MLGSFSRSPLQAHTGDPNDHLLVSPARGTALYSHTGDPRWLIDNATVFSPRRKLKTAVFKDSFI